MGKLESEFQFTGPVGNLSAYRMRGVDKIIIRKKGGASRNKIRNSPEFEKTRLHNKEFSGRARGVHWMRCALRPLIPVSDHNISGPLNKLMAYVQYRDEVTDIGQRTIALSKNASLLEGFSLNRDSDLNNLVKAPLRYSLSRETLSATVEIPKLIPRRNFSPPKEHPFFCVVAVLAAVPDLYHMDRGCQPYAPSHPGYNQVPVRAATEWLRVKEGSPVTALEVKLQSPPPADDYALVLSIGVCFGTPAPGGSVELVKRAGCAKIVAVSGSVISDLSTAESA